MLRAPYQAGHPVPVGTMASTWDRNICSHNFVSKDTEGEARRKTLSVPGGRRVPGLFWLPGTAGVSPLRTKPGVMKFVDEQSVADFQLLSRLPSIPAIRPQRGQNDVLLSGSDSLFAPTLGRNLEVRLGNGRQESTDRRCMIPEYESFGTDQYVPGNAV